MLEGSNEIRFGSAPDLFRAARAQVRRWDRNAAGIEDITKVGLKGSPTIVSRVFVPSSRARKALQIGFDPANPEVATQALLDKLLAEFPKVKKELDNKRAAAGEHHE